MTTKRLFEPGFIYMTPGFWELGVNPLPYLERHLSGDWGDVCAADWVENDISLIQGYRIFSVYQTPSGVKFWVITEADRSITTFLLPDEY
jgi:hypothetical protein